MNNKTIKKTLTLALCAILALSLLSGCGSRDNKPAEAEAPAAKEPAAAAPSKEDPAGADDKESDGALTKSEDAKDTDALIGDWEMVYELSHSVYGKDNESSDYCTMSDDEYSISSEMIIKEADGKYLADYKYDAYESSNRFYGCELIKKDGPAYAECDNKDWYMEFANPFNDDYESRKFTLLDDETLAGISTYTYGEEGTDDYSYSVYTDIYLRKDSPKLADRESLRYFDTVTVSNVEDLVKNLQNNRKIILEEGTYDFSLLNLTDIDNEHYLGMDELPDSYRTYTISYLSNFCLEAKDGADVLLCTDNAYDPVMCFMGSNNITLRGLTCGHVVEPGYCSGSVIALESASNITFDDCHLYGCGTYGIETKDCDNIEVNDTEIYECTYGLVSLYNTGSMHFNNCTLRDSSDMSMICINSGYDITFTDCTFKNNRILADYPHLFFADLSEYSDLSFTGCRFENNQYDKFANRKVKMTECTINDNSDADMSNIEMLEAGIDKDGLIKSYEESKARQKEIDDRFQNDSMDQQTMNRLAYEEFEMWDILLNNIWGYLKNTMEEGEMESLTEEQKKWIRDKEDAVKTAAADFEGGSMQPMIENGTAADQTEKRVDHLMEKYITSQD